MIDLYKCGNIRIIKYGKLLGYKYINNDDDVIYTSTIFTVNEIQKYSLNGYMYDFTNATEINLKKTNEHVIYQIMRTLKYNNIILVPVPFSIHFQLQDIDCVIFGRVVAFKDQKDMEMVKIISRLASD